MTREPMCGLMLLASGTQEPIPRHCVALLTADSLCALERFASTQLYVTRIVRLHTCGSTHVPPHKTVPNSMCSDGPQCFPSYTSAARASEAYVATLLATHLHLTKPRLIQHSPYAEPHTTFVCNVNVTDTNKHTNPPFYTRNAT